LKLAKPTPGNDGVAELQLIAAKAVGGETNGSERMMVNERA
jgi:hypothetical protein